MILSDVSVRRPVFAMVLSLLLTIIGLMAAARLSVRETPNVQPPIVSVDTVYRGASAPEPVVVRRGEDPRALAREGLVGLGFSAQEADRLLDGAAGETPEALIAEALRAAR